MSDTRVFHCKAATINDYDKNKTVSYPFFAWLKGDNLVMDIIWGEGT